MYYTSFYLKNKEGKVKIEKGGKKRIGGAGPIC
jgi:hypothetical protein